jgi:hypothetical protein
MKNKKYILSLMLTGVTLLLGFFLTSLTDSNKLKAQEVVATISDNIFQDVKIVVPAEKNRVLTQEDYLKNNSEVKVNMTFKFTNKDYEIGDTFVTTLPEGFTYKEVIEGELGTASYRIDPANRKLALTMTQDVQSAEYKLELITRIKFDESANSKQQMLFETQTPSSYILHLYAKDDSKYIYGKTFDADGNEAKLMPVRGGEFPEMNINYKHIDLATNNLEVRWSTRSIPSFWTDGYVNMINDLSSYKFHTYETNINGEPISEKKELKAGEDFTIIQKSEGVVQLKFNERFHEALEVSGGEVTFDYDDFNPISDGRSSGMDFYMLFEIYPNNSTTNSLSYARYSASFKVKTLGYLGLGKIQADNNVKDKEPIVKTPIYINGTNQQLKKGDTFILTNKEIPSIVTIDTNLAREYRVSLDQSGGVSEGTKNTITNWKISSETYGEITLTYLGEDTTETLGLDLYVGRTTTKDWPTQNPFILSGNGYQTTGKSNFIYNEINEKTGSFNAAKNVITWTATVNSLYQKITKLTDTFDYGIKAGTLKNLKISSVEFGKNGAKEDLVQGTDYEIVDKSTTFEIKFLKEVKEKLTITYETGVDVTTMNPSSLRAMNIITPEFQFASSDEKEFPTVGYAYVPDYLLTNVPSLLGKNSSNSFTEKIEQQPVNRVKLLINPSGANIVNNEVIANYKSLDVVVLEEAFTVNKVEQLSVGDYSQLQLGAEVMSDSEEYPEIIIEENQISVKNKKLTQPIVVSFILAKNNYYNVVSDYVKLSQTTNGSEPVTGRNMLYYRNALPSSFILKTSSNYANIAEGILTINKINGSTLIKGTEITLGNIFEIDDDVKELNNLREVTDGDGNSLPVGTVSITGGGYQAWRLIINEDGLDNGLIVKTNWSFKTSGTKRYNSGGHASHPYVDNTNKNSAVSYERTSIWQGNFDIDNSGAGGSGVLIFTDFTINMTDSVTQTPLAGAEYEISDKNGKVITTVTADSKGQILLKDLVVADYTLKEIKAPEGYLSNKEYSGSGKQITLTNSDKNELTIPYVKEGKINVHFTYEDGTDIETVEPITLTGGNGTTINLKEQNEVKEQLEKMNAASDYRFLSYNQGAVAGTEEAAVFPYNSEKVYYKYEGLLSLQVPELLTFETGFVSPFTQILSYENQDDFKVSLRDSRQITSSALTKESKTRGNIRLNASLSKEFKTSNNKVLKDARLLYQNGTEQVVLNGSGGEVVNNQQVVADPAKKDFTFVLNTAGNKSQGFKLEVPARGTLADVYTGEVTWEIVQEP